MDREFTNLKTKIEVIDSTCSCNLTINSNKRYFIFNVQTNSREPPC